MLTSSRALTIALETLAEGRSRSFALLACIVLDRGGHIPARLRDENASIYRPELRWARRGAASAWVLAGGNAPSAGQRCRCPHPARQA
jgi:uncharacterized protein GlcG (DUF336 family)